MLMSKYVKLDLQAGTILKASHMGYLETGIEKAHNELEHHLANHPSGDAKGLEFHWDGTRLGIRREGELAFVYVDLKGANAKEIELRVSNTMLQWRYVDGDTWHNLVNLMEMHPATHPASMITGLSRVAMTGDYNDLINKPNIIGGGNSGGGSSSGGTCDVDKAYVDTELSKKADKTHEHTIDDLLDLDVYSKQETNEIIESITTEMVLSETANDLPIGPGIVTDEDIDLITESKKIWVSDIIVDNKTIIGCIDHMQFNEKAIQILFPWTYNVRGIYRRVRNFSVWTEWELICEGTTVIPTTRAICGEFLCGQVKANEGVREIDEINTDIKISKVKSSLSSAFLEKARKWS